MEPTTVTARARWSASSLATPFGLKVGMVVSAVAVGVFGVAGARAAIDRHAAADDVVARAAPLLLDAQNLYVALADADAAASTIFLRAGLEPRHLRERYTDDLRRAGDRLAAIAAADLGPEATAAAGTLAEDLPAYAGYVEAARANSRQGYPVGAAYLRRASELMRTSILPAATAVYEAAVVELDGRYRDGTSPGGPSTVAVTAGLAVLAVLVTQLYVTSRTRRWLNPGLLVAAVTVVATATASSLLLDQQADALTESRDDGADLVTSLSTARILTLRSLSDENLDLIERGTEPHYIEDFDVHVARLGLGGDDGLLGRALDAAPDRASRAALASLVERYDAYLAAHVDVRRLDETDHAGAVELAVTDEAAAAQAVDVELADLIARSSTALDEDAHRARDLAGALPVLVVLAAVGAAGAVIVGMQPRLREYR